MGDMHFKGTFISHVSALPNLVRIFTINVIILYVTNLLLSGNDINFALIYLLISTEVSRATA